MRENKLHHHIYQSGDTDIIIAARNNNIRHLAALLSSHSGFVNQQNDWKSTALIEAAKFGNVEVIGMLLAYGANTSLLTHNGETALIHATRNKHQEVVRLLLQKDMLSFEKENQLEQTAFNLVASEGNEEMLALFLMSGFSLNTPSTRWPQWISNNSTINYLTSLEQIISATNIQSTEEEMKYKIAAMVYEFHKQQLFPNLSPAILQEAIIALIFTPSVQKFFFLQRDLQSKILQHLTNSELTNPSIIINRIGKFIDRINIDSVKNGPAIQSSAIELAEHIVKSSNHIEWDILEVLELLLDPQKLENAHADSLSASLTCKDPAKNLLNKINGLDLPIYSQIRNFIAPHGTDYSAGKKNADFLPEFANLLSLYRNLGYHPSRSKLRTNSTGTDATDMEIVSDSEIEQTSSQRSMIQNSQTSWFSTR